MKKVPANESVVGRILKDGFIFDENDIPKAVYEELARCFLPDILAFYESNEGKKEYENWKNKQNLS